ncbi:Uncharacterized protein TCM_005191 [Theobroma cacao]|uniref:Uncharacterized protein n=1 Tax=Theobroma cacao TaxID=3641 RepID=A0A061DUN1_THECC|nr:Uncharacterized protein TCM_005191 [Theobroma cacao]
MFFVLRISAEISFCLALGILSFARRDSLPARPPAVLGALVSAPTERLLKFSHKQPYVLKARLYSTQSIETRTML